MENKIVVEIPVNVVGMMQDKYGYIKRRLSEAGVPLIPSVFGPHISSGRMSFEEDPRKSVYRYTWEEE